MRLLSIGDRKKLLSLFVHKYNIGNRCPASIRFRFPRWRCTGENFVALKMSSALFIILPVTVDRYHVKGCTLEFSCYPDFQCSTYLKCMHNACEPINMARGSASICRSNITVNLPWQFIGSSTAVRSSLPARKSFVNVSSLHYYYLTENELLIHLSSPASGYSQ